MKCLLAVNFRQTKHFFSCVWLFLSKVNFHTKKVEKYIIFFSSCVSFIKIIHKTDYCFAIKIKSKFVNFTYVEYFFFILLCAVNFNGRSERCRHMDNRSNSALWNGRAINSRLNPNAKKCTAEKNCVVNFSIEQSLIEGFICSFFFSLVWEKCVEETEKICGLITVFQDFLRAI